MGKVTLRPAGKGGEVARLIGFQVPASRLGLPFSRIASQNVPAATWTFSDRHDTARTDQLIHREEIIMPTGTVKWFNATKGYGFIAPEDGSKDAFVHISAVERAGLGTLHEGQRLHYELRPGRNGKFSAEELAAAD